MALLEASTPYTLSINVHNNPPKPPRRTQGGL